jgi:hypothetical protein
MHVHRGTNGPALLLRTSAYWLYAPRQDYDHIIDVADRKQLSIDDQLCMLDIIDTSGQGVCWRTSCVECPLTAYRI